VNLATQALIKGYSKSKHYDLANPDDHIPDTEDYIRDEVGLIRAIAVKVRTAKHCLIIAKLIVLTV